MSVFQSYLGNANFIHVKMSLSFNKIRCNYPHGQSRVLEFFEKMPLLDPVCKTPLYRWSRYYSICAALTFIVRLVFHTWFHPNQFSISGHKLLSEHSIMLNVPGESAQVCEILTEHQCASTVFLLQGGTP